MVPSASCTARVYPSERPSRGSVATTWSFHTASLACWLTATREAHGRWSQQPVNVQVLIWFRTVDIKTVVRVGCFVFIAPSIAQNLWILGGKNPTLGKVYHIWLRDFDGLRGWRFQMHPCRGAPPKCRENTFLILALSKVTSETV